MIGDGDKSREHELMGSVPTFPFRNEQKIRNLSYRTYNKDSKLIFLTLSNEKKNHQKLSFPQLKLLAPI